MVEQRAFPAGAFAIQDHVGEVPENEGVSNLAVKKPVRRLRLFGELVPAGADVGFVEAPIDNEQIAAIAKLPWPQLVNIVVGGKTPEMSIF